MKSNKKSLLLGVTLIIIGGAVYFTTRPGQAPGPNALRAEDRPRADASRLWAEFGGSPARNMVNLNEKNVPDDWDTGKGGGEKKNIKWVAKLGSRAYGGPVISGGKVFVGTNNESPRNKRDRDPKKVNPVTKEPVAVDKGILMAFRESDGKFLWQHVNDKLPSSLVHDWPHEGVCSTPIVQGDRLWYVSNRCEVVCLDTEGLANGNQGVEDEQYKDPTDADVIWKLDMMKELNVFPHNMSACSPMILGDILFVVTANGVDEGHINIPSPEAPSFIALEKKTGKLLWKDNSPGKNIMHGQWSNPSYAEIGGVAQVIFPGGDGWLHAFDPKTGEKLWQCDCNPKDAVYKLGPEGTKNDFIATPVIHDGKIYIGVGQDPEHTPSVGHLWCIDPAGKKGDISEVLVTDATNFPPMTKPNPNSGIVWHFGGPNNDPNGKREYFFSRTMSTCAVHDGLCYAADLDGFMYCLDAKTGKLYWQHDLKGAVWGSPYWVDGKVYIGTEDGDVFIFAHGKEKKQLAKIDMGEPVRSTPVVANGVLYVMTEGNLYAIQKK
ncbi:MAG: PQQ-binding-like beta-propeller repeat protein [Gemmataceae bacterium]